MLAVVLIALIGLTEAVPTGYIINGEDSAKGRWPWQISLQVKRDDGSSGHSCGGSLIRKDWVLTASHCVFFDRKPSSYLVKLGGFQLSADDFDQTLGVSQIIMHPEFGMFASGVPNDIALLKLDGDADLSSPNIALVDLPVGNQKFAGNINCYITGWGRADRETQLPSDKLQEAHVPVWTNDECKDMYGFLIWMMPLFEHHICTGDPSPEVDTSACHGDSGGPLVCDISGAGDWRLAGVTSRGGSADCDKYPTVYTRVSSFLDWIDQYA